MNAVSPGQLVHILDQLSQRRFLVDTGAAFSVFPHSSDGPPCGPALAGAAGQPIPCWGEKQFRLSFNGKEFSWPFLLAAVQFPIIGVDFLRHYGLLADPAGNRLVDRLTLQSFCSSPLGDSQPVTAPSTGLSSSSPASTPSAGSPLGNLASAATCSKQVRASEVPRVKVPSGSRGTLLEAAHVSSLDTASGFFSVMPSLAATCGKQGRASEVPRVKAPSGSRGTLLEAAHPASVATVSDILREFPEVVNEGKALPVPAHDVEHHIKTVGPPIASKFRWLEGDKLEAARLEFEVMEREGIIRRSTSPWASPLHMVPKKDGSWRPCGDFRRLNLVTEADVYPLPNMLDFSDRLAGCKVFSKIDLRKGYWQIPVKPEDVQKTAVITPFGLFEFLRMPFGLRNAGSSFQRMMDRVLAGLQFAYCYLDDLRIASPDMATHRQHLHQVFQRLQQFGLVINLEKCVFAVEAFEFLGHLVSAKGTRPLTSYVEAVEKRPPPSTVKELQVFLGLINFYRKFLPGVAITLRPLTDALRGNRPAGERLYWSPEMEAGFVGAKAALSRATWLGHPDPASQLALHVDASSSHVGAALHQQPKEAWIGNLWGTSLASWRAPRQNGVHSTGSFTPAWRESAISASSSRAGLSRFIQTTSLWWEHWLESQISGQLTSVAIWHTWPSSRRTSGKWQARTTWRRTHCRGRRSPPSLRLLLHRLW